MKIYCLNLERAVNRKENIVQEWINKKSFDIEFFSAFDRRVLESGESPIAYNPEAAFKASGKYLSLGEIANITSFIQLYEHALKEGHDEIVIMEDDVLPVDFLTPQYMLDTIRTCKNAFPRVAVLIMHNPNAFVRTSESKNGISLLALPPFGNYFIWVNKKAMEMLVKDLRLMLFPSDWLWAKRMAPMKLMAIADEPLCYHCSTDSYIGNESGVRTFIP